MAAHQAPPSLGFSRQEHWSGLPFPSPVHENESEVSQSCPTLSDPMDCSPPGSSILGIFQARVLEWGAIAFSSDLHGDSHFKQCSTLWNQSSGKAFMQLPKFYVKWNLTHKWFVPKFFRFQWTSFSSLYFFPNAFLWEISHIHRSWEIML